MRIEFRHKIFILIAAIALTATLSAQEDLFPNNVKVSTGYRSNLIGGEVDTRAHIPAGSFIWSPHIWTYQSTEGWSEWNIGLRSVFTFCPTCDYGPEPTHFRVLGDFAMIGEYLDLSARNPSASFDTKGLIYRYRPHIELGVGMDSVGIFCRECTWTYTGELTVSDFIPMAYQFSNEEAPGETLSAGINFAMRIDTPGGTVGLLQRSNARKYFGEDIWRAYYGSPMILDVLRLTLGWETAYLGFGRLDLNLSPFVDSDDFTLQFGVHIPEETSFWQWQLGVVFEPIPERPGRPGYKSGGYWR